MATGSKRISNILRLPGVLELPAPSALLDQIAMQWKALDSSDGIHRLLDSGTVEWQAGNVRLAERASAHDDNDALLQLVGRDPRYLGTELVQAKIALWRLQIVYQNRRIPLLRKEDDAPTATSASPSLRAALPGSTPTAPVVSRATAKMSKRAQAARKLLLQLGAKLGYIAGSRRREYIDPRELARQHLVNTRRIEKARPLLPKLSVSVATVASVADLPEEYIRLLRDDPRYSSSSAATQSRLATAWDYGLSEERIRACLRDARKRLDDHRG